MAELARKLIYEKYVMLTYSCLIALLFVGLVETGCRILEHFGPRTFVFRQFDNLLGVSLIPNVAGVHRHCFDGYVSINSHGMRDAPRKTSRPAGVLRIGLFGDSIVEGVHVFPDQLASTRLQRRLNNEICDANCEVLNFGVGGFGTLQEWLRYKRDGRKFGLDIVVLLFIGNDVDNNLPATSNFDQTLYDAPYLSLGADAIEKYHMPVKPRYYGILSFLTTHSAFFRFSYKVYFHLIYQKNRFSPDIVTFDVRDGLALRPDYLTLESRLGRAGWSVTEHLLKRFAVDVQNDGADFIVFHSGYDIPNPTKRDLEVAKKYEKVTGLKIELRFGQKWFTKFSQRTGIPVYDWETYKTNYVIRQHLRDVGLGYSCDGHFNPEGHAVLANFLYEKLESAVRSKLLGMRPQ